MNFSQILFSQNILHCQLLSPLRQERGVDDVAPADDHDDGGPRVHPRLPQRPGQLWQLVWKLSDSLPGQEPGVARGQDGAARDLDQHAVVVSEPGDPESWRPHQ